MLHQPITYYWIYILKIQPLDHIFYMFLTCMPIECNLPFDLLLGRRKNREKCYSSVSAAKIGLLQRFYVPPL